MGLVHRNGLRGAALATLLFFGCATTRQPLPPPPPSPPVDRVYFSEPDIELWVEGTDAVDPAESQRAQERSRAAVQAALDGRGVPAAEAEAVLTLRERAVARTSGRKTNQGLATAGLVVGVVIVVAVVVAAVVAGKGKGGGSSGASAGRASAPAPAPSIGAGAPRAAGAVAAAPRAAEGAAAAAATAPRAAGAAVSSVPRAAGVAGAVSAQSHQTLPAPPPGAPASPSGSAHPTAPAPPPGTVVARQVPVPSPPPHVGADVYVNVWAPPEPYPRAYLPPPSPPFSVKERGFFDPDEVLLELELRDGRSGAVLWGAAVRGWVDPRDPGEVAELVEKALADQPWARRGARPPPSPAAGEPVPAR